ncbi:DUF445 family protein [Aquibacillus koreensis]|uniref:DUF445 family protein n=1 Tax=Aquibacillus koreensis TaxID=279446 RepID=A0A9X3WK92_9BACI|nr:DUF445 family protein [Aquibacillus koreensis]MCT2535547.1 DUF445 family protein [Aquibacillus koreensis]MDC3420168.1 DUF445 family protein [Aquibacillus koreensis]
MSAIFIISMMIVIGAIIGGVTNSLAIKMLFRPYEPKYIGKWKVPFTPGLIPKRRDELAKQLGKTVVEHLLTAEGMKKRLNQEAFRQQLITWSKSEVEQMLSSEASVKEMLEGFGVNLEEENLRQKVATWSESYYERIMEQNRHKSIRSLLDEEWISKANKGVDKLSGYAQEKLIDFVSSDEARNKMVELVETYLAGKGFFGNMIASFMGNETLVDNIQPMLVQYIRTEESRQLIKDVLANELEQLLDKPVSEIENKLGEEATKKTVGRMIALNLPLDVWLNKPITVLFESLKVVVLNKITPTIIEKVLSIVMQRMDVIMSSIQLEDIVEKEVASFPIQRVEELVLNISKKEFTLITYLGALLGGIIGFIQGIIVLTFG